MKDTKQEELLKGILLQQCGMMWIIAIGIIYIVLGFVSILIDSFWNFTIIAIPTAIFFYFYIPKKFKDYIIKLEQ